MSSILMAGCYDFFLIKWIANILGIIMSGLYNFFGLFGLFNIGLCIIVFTIICKMILIPITIKQQKFTKVSSKMTPELQAIQKKYEGKRDNASMMKQQEETRALYEKYGTSPTGSCLPLFIQMFILLALYAVIISIPEYVKPVGEIYQNISNEIVEVFDDYDDLYNANSALDSNYKDEEFSTLIKNNYDSTKTIDENNTAIYANLCNLYATVKPLDDFNNGYDKAIAIINTLKSTSEDKWNELITKEKAEKNPSDYKLALYEKFKGYSDTDWDNYKNELVKVKSNVSGFEDQISSIYTFAWIDLSKSPSNLPWYALIIPILSFLTQWLSMKISTSSQPSMEGNPMASSLKVMNFTMPLISAFLCYSLPAGLGLYWVMAAVVQIIQQLFINHHFKDMDVDEIIKSNVEKANKKKAKKGVNPDENKISGAASYSTKGIKVDYSKFESFNKDSKEEENTASENTEKELKKGSIAQRANMVKDFNDRNSKK